jgi:hypothetical protein
MGRSSAAAQWHQAKYQLTKKGSLWFKWFLHNNLPRRTQQMFKDEQRRIVWSQVRQHALRAFRGVETMGVETSRQIGRGRLFGARRFSVAPARAPTRAPTAKKEPPHPARRSKEFYRAPLCTEFREKWCAHHRRRPGQRGAHVRHPAAGVSMSGSLQPNEEDFMWSAQARSAALGGGLVALYIKSH